MKLALFLPIILAGCATPSERVNVLDAKTADELVCKQHGGRLEVKDGVAQCVATYPADRYDDAHPEAAGLREATPTDCEPECLFDPEGTGDEDGP